MEMVVHLLLAHLRALLITILILYIPTGWLRRRLKRKRNREAAREVLQERGVLLGPWREELHQPLWWRLLRPPP